MGWLNAKCIVLNEKNQSHPDEGWGSGEEKIKEGIVKNG